MKYANVQVVIVMARTRVALAFASLVIASAFTSSACFDVGIPNGAVITCANDGECPDKFVCQDARGVCVFAGGQLDETPPSLSNVVLEPEKGGLDTEFTLRFDVSEELTTDPDVLVDIGGGVDNGARFTISPDVNRESRSYEYKYASTGAEANGEPSPVIVRLIDKSLNPSGNLSGGVITFDFVPPAFQGAPTLSDEDGIIGPGDELRVTFVATEALSSASITLVPVLADAPPLLLGEQASGEHTYVVSGLELDGDYVVEGTLTDESGNIATGLFAGRIVLDVTPPAAQDGAVLRRADQLGDDRGDELVDLNAGAVLVVTFVATEPLAAEPAVRLACPAGAVVGERTGDVTSDIVFVHRFVVTSALGEGACDVRADLLDVAGNAATDAVIVAAAVAADQTAPLAPDVDSPGAVLYRRVPWGNAATGGVRRFTIDGLAGAVEPDGLVSVYESADAAFVDAIGRSLAGVDGAFALALNPVDRADVFVAQTDPAGNEGPRVRVRDVEWTASMGGKEAGSTFVNPHRFESRALFGGDLQQGSTVERGDEAALVDGVRVTTTGAGTWTNTTETRAPPALESPAMAYDAVRGRLVVFGGASCNCATSGSIEECPDTFTRDGVVWRELTIVDPDGDSQPQRQSGSALVHDVVNGAPLLFGKGGAADVWRLEGATGTSWRNACDGGCAAAGPTPRQRFGAAHDPVHRQTVIFGGRLDSGAFSDETWLFDGAGWREVCADATCPKPSARAAHAMTYDADAGEVLLFGGDDSGILDGRFGSSVDGGQRNDIWAFDAATSEWVELCTDAACAASKPPPRSDTAMAFDPIHGETIIYGGLEGGPGDCGGAPPDTTFVDNFADTVAWDGAGFRTITPLDPELDGDPGARRLHAMTWDPRRERVTLLSGVLTDPCATLECVHAAEPEQWEWDGSSWRRFRNAPQPPNSSFTLSAAWDETRSEVLMVGAGNAIFRFGDQWRSSGALALSDARVSAHLGNVAVFGGENSGGTKVASTAFATDTDFFPLLCFFPPCPLPPPARAEQAAAESPLGGMFIFGGVDNSNGDFGDSWRLNGNWAQECVGCASGTTRPPDRTLGAMALDEDRGVTVLFAGKTPPQSPFNIKDTWEWDGDSWVVLSPTEVPSQRNKHTLVYDPLRKRTILFGGENGGFFGFECGNGESICSDLWEWDGASWIQPTIVDNDEDDNPGGRFSHAMAFSRRLGKSVMNGGGNNQTWLYDSGGGSRSGQVLAVAYAAAGTGFGDNVDDEEILDVEARFVAGGIGEAGVGATLLVWDVDGWRSLATNGASDAAPAPVRWSSVEQPLDDVPAQNPLPRLFFGKERTLAFAVTPTAANGGRPGFGALATDQGEVVVRYRLP